MGADGPPLTHSCTPNPAGSRAAPWFRREPTRGPTRGACCCDRGPGRVIPTVRPPSRPGVAAVGAGQEPDHRSVQRSDHRRSRSLQHCGVGATARSKRNHRAAPVGTGAIGVAPWTKLFCPNASSGSSVVCGRSPEARGDSPGGSALRTEQAVRLVGSSLGLVSWTVRRAPRKGFSRCVCC